MNPTTSSRYAALSIFLLALPFAVSGAQDQITPVAELRSLLANKQTDAAIKLIESAQQNTQPDFLLLRGVAYQQLAAQSSDTEMRRIALQKAEAAYKSALAASAPAEMKPPAAADPPKGAGSEGPPRIETPKPVEATPTSPNSPATQRASQSAAALNNLASLYATTGDDQNARSYYNQAIAANDSRRGYYALNFARYLETRDPTHAIAMARIAVESSPDSVTAHDYLGQLLWSNRIEDMLPFADNLAKHGYPDTANKWAIRCLRTGNRPADERRAWLVMLARNAARSSRYGTALGNQTDEIGSLQSDSEIGRGAAQLRLVLVTAPQSPQAIDWWSNQSNMIASLGISPRDAMRDLLRASGEAVLQKDPQSAGVYLRAALDIDARNPDPDVFLRLVELYANNKSVSSLNQLQELMRDYQQRMFNTKSDAYAHDNWPLIYRMHVALGMTYAYLGVWQSDSPYQNAIFQLDSAQKAADSLNAQAVSQNRPDRVVLPPNAVAKLAEGYAITHRRDLSLQAKVTGAANLQKFGYARESNDVLETIAAEHVNAASPAVKKQIKELKSVAMQAK